MKKKLLIVGTIFLLITITGLTGCIEPAIEGTGTIVFNSFEGGFYGIIMDEDVQISGINLGRNFDPINLPEEFKEEDLRVHVKARLSPQISIHQWGYCVKIVEIEELDQV